MTSTAISAQGSTLAVSGSAGTAKNITAIALGNPTILTSAAHGFANGDILTLAGLTGADAGVLNGQTVVIKNITANTFAVDVDTTGKTITAAGTATPVTWTPIGNLTSFKGFDGQANEIDKTNLTSTAKEFMLGLQDFGHFTFDVDKDFTDPGQLACDAAKRAGTLKQFKLTLPNSKTATFSGYVKNSPLDGGVDQILKTTGVSIRITGDVVYA
ncbi:phage tail tube protein [Pandoraea communis]|uniref:phage tail tube protein n=1 Tax=Pandoraea communis TaxID=2508297 RepID=UPI0025A5C257|nr:phage tail tube protein [Pandoraea communis]MDM8356671.1 phage tail tube protein [Pandoraea communis]